MTRLLWSQTNRYLLLTLEHDPNDVQVQLSDNLKQIEFIFKNQLYKFYLKKENSEIHDFEILRSGRYLKVRFEKIPNGFWKKNDFGWTGGIVEIDWDRYEDSDDENWKTFEISP